MPMEEDNDRSCGITPLYISSLFFGRARVNEQAEAFDSLIIEA